MVVNQNDASKRKEHADTGARFDHECSKYNYELTSGPLGPCQTIYTKTVQRLVPIYSIFPSSMTIEYRTVTRVHVSRPYHIKQYCCTV